MWANCRVLSVCPLLCACFLSVGAVTVHLARFPYEGVYAYIDIWHTLLCFLLMDIFHIKNRLIFSGRSTIKNESNQLLGGGGQQHISSAARWLKLEGHEFVDRYIYMPHIYPPLPSPPPPSPSQAPLPKTRTLYSPGCTGTQYVDKAGLELLGPVYLWSFLLGLKTGTYHTLLRPNLKTNIKTDSKLGWEGS